jgi:hypothetical protein
MVADNRVASSPAVFTNTAGSQKTSVPGFLGAGGFGQSTGHIF